MKQQSQQQSQEQSQQQGIELECNFDDDNSFDDDQQQQQQVDETKNNDEGGSSFTDYGATEEEETDYDAEALSRLNTTTMTDNTVLVRADAPISQEFRQIIGSDKSLQNLNFFYPEDVGGIAELLFCHQNIRPLMTPDAQTERYMQFFVVYNAVKNSMS